jgi:hypothetical protein
VRVIYKNGGWAYLAIRVRRALKTRLGDQALEISRQLLLESVDTGTFGRTGGPWQRYAVSRAHVGNPRPAPRAWRTQDTWSILDPSIPRITVTRITAGTLHGRDGVVGALDGIESAAAVGIGRTLLTGRGIAVEPRHTGAIVH